MRSVFLQLCVFLFVIFMGIIFGSLVKIGFSFKRRKAVFSRRFAPICIFLALSGILYTILIFETKNLFPISDFVSLYEVYAAELAATFFFGVVLSLFWKIALPIFAFLYAFAFFFTNWILDSSFNGQADSISIRIEEKSIHILGNEIPADSEKQNFLAIETLSLPDTLLLPVKRNFYSSVDFFDAARTEKSLKLYQASVTDFSRNFLVKKYIDFFLLKNANISRVEVGFPDERVFPSLYCLRFSFSAENPSVSFVREL